MMSILRRPRKLFEFLYENGELSHILGSYYYRLAANCFTRIGSRPTCEIEFCDIVSSYSYFQMFVYLYTTRLYIQVVVNLINQIAINVE